MFGQVLVTVVSMQSGVSDIPHARFEEAKKLYGVGSGDVSTYQYTLSTHPQHVLSRFFKASYNTLLPLISHILTQCNAHEFYRRSFQIHLF